MAVTPRIAEPDGHTTFPIPEIDAFGASTNLQWYVDPGFLDAAGFLNDGDSYLNWTDHSNKTEQFSGFGSPQPAYKRNIFASGWPVINMSGNARAIQQSHITYSQPMHHFMVLRMNSTPPAGSNYKILQRLSGPGSFISFFQGGGGAKGIRLFAGQYCQQIIPDVDFAKLVGAYCLFEVYQNGNASFVSARWYNDSPPTTFHYTNRGLGDHSGNRVMTYPVWGGTGGMQIAFSAMYNTDHIANHPQLSEDVWQWARRRYHLKEVP